MSTPWKQRTVLVLVGLTVAAFFLLESNALQFAPQVAGSGGRDIQVAEALLEKVVSASAEASIDVASNGDYGLEPPRSGELIESVGVGQVAAALCDWPRSFQRSDHNLAVSVVQCTVDVGELMRHVWTNPRDIRICEEKEAELTALVRRCNDVIKPLTMHMRQVMMDEQISMIDSGVVLPWVPGKIDLTKPATALVRYYAGIGKDISMEQALAELSRNSMLHTGGPKGHRIFHKGNWYGRSSFPSLPRTTAVHAYVSSGATEAFLPVLGWFVANGYMNRSEVDNVIEAFFLLSPP